MRTIKTIHKAHFAPIADLVTYSPLPSETVQMIDPFLFLNHHGHQKYPPNNNGLPFGPHPHRGMETVTFILEGDIMHKDSGSHQSVIEAGGVQWMSAGKGLIHAEVSSDKFKKEGGELEILQLWLNLPAKHKMMEPAYLGLQDREIPRWNSDDNKLSIQVLSGEFKGVKGAFSSVAGISLYTLYMQAGSTLQFDIPKDHNIFFYIVRGKILLDDQLIDFRNLVEFNHDDDKIDFAAEEKAVVILGHAMPLNEPVVAQGPFVMNTQAEILQAYSDYRAGKFGLWNE
jgi:quercetin 2,3-dioxygenase